MKEMIVIALYVDKFRHFTPELIIIQADGFLIAYKENERSLFANMKLNS